MLGINSGSIITLFWKFCYSNLQWYCKKETTFSLQIYMKTFQNATDCVNGSFIGIKPQINKFETKIKAARRELFLLFSKVLSNSVKWIIRWWWDVKLFLIKICIIYKLLNGRIHWNKKKNLQILPLYVIYNSLLNWS